MFGWLRKWWHDGQIPEPPADDLLDFPGEEEWVFDFDAWKWRAQEIPHNPYAEDDEDDGEEVTELDVVKPELQVGVHESVPESRCCGGQCKLNQPQ
jgi:hypothetical protein